MKKKLIVPTLLASLVVGTAFSAFPAEKQAQVTKNNTAFKSAATSNNLPASGKIDFKSKVSIEIPYTSEETISKAFAKALIEKSSISQEKAGLIKEAQIAVINGEKNLKIKTAELQKAQINMVYEKELKDPAAKFKATEKRNKALKSVDDGIKLTIDTANRKGGQSEELYRKEMDRIKKLKEADSKAIDSLMKEVTKTSGAAEKAHSNYMVDTINKITASNIQALSDAKKELLKYQSMLLDYQMKMAILEQDRQKLQNSNPEFGKQIDSVKRKITEYYNLERSIITLQEYKVKEEDNFLRKQLENSYKTSKSKLK